MTKVTRGREHPHPNPLPEGEGNSWTNLILLLALSLGGCGTSSRDAEKVSRREPALTMTDPCAMRLHDLSGALLLYHANHGVLPETLEELRSMPGALAPLESFDCPVSHQAYQYDPNGEKKGENTLLLYDPAPAHDGKRWVVHLLDWKPGSPLVTKVDQLSEKLFSGPR